LAGWITASGCHGGQSDEGIIAQWRDGFQAHEACAPDGTFIALFQQQCADQADYGILVGKDADNV